MPNWALRPAREGQPLVTGGRVYAHRGPVSSLSGRFVVQQGEWMSPASVLLIVGDGGLEALGRWSDSPRACREAVEF